MLISLLILRWMLPHKNETEKEDLMSSYSYFHISAGIIIDNKHEDLDREQTQIPQKSAEWSSSRAVIFIDRGAQEHA